ncbi:hypothetical protein STIAU_4510 [Stigmatella aurantiaca DW4/3-1]|uniref:Uncharacterized protein n=1 Tax=Stigmatella aurantiaca (strain DW4/3-1) TaxID=378806 RepID=Q08VC3_STIAD|nr:hypothetical protein STIAU_4510 [Stigmatella aurantiaca DW4/3-1]
MCERGVGGLHVAQRQLPGRERLPQGRRVWIEPHEEPQQIRRERVPVCPRQQLLGREQLGAQRPRQGLPVQHLRGLGISQPEKALCPGEQHGDGARVGPPRPLEQQRRALGRGSRGLGEPQDLLGEVRVHGRSAEGALEGLERRGQLWPRAQRHRADGLGIGRLPGAREPGDVGPELRGELEGFRALLLRADAQVVLEEAQRSLGGVGGQDLGAERGGELLRHLDANADEQPVGPGLVGLFQRLERGPGIRGEGLPGEQRRHLGERGGEIPWLGRRREARAVEGVKGAAIGEDAVQPLVQHLVQGILRGDGPPPGATFQEQLGDGAGEVFQQLRLVLHVRGEGNRQPLRGDEEQERARLGLAARVRHHVVAAHRVGGPAHPVVGHPPIPRLHRDLHEACRLGLDERAGHHRPPEREQIDDRGARSPSGEAGRDIQPGRAQQGAVHQAVAHGMVEVPGAEVIQRRVHHPRGGEDLLLEVLPIGHPGGVFDQRAQEVEPIGRVDELRSGLGDEGPVLEERERLGGAHPLRDVVFPGRVPVVAHPAQVPEELAHRDGPGLGGELGHPAADVIVQADLACLHQLQHRHGGEGLGDGGGAVRRPRGRRAMLRDVPEAIAHRPGGIALGDAHRESRQEPALEVLADAGLQGLGLPGRQGLGPGGEQDGRGRRPAPGGWGGSLVPGGRRGTAQQQRRQEEPSSAGEAQPAKDAHGTCQAEARVSYRTSSARSQAPTTLPRWNGSWRPAGNGGGVTGRQPLPSAAMPRRGTSVAHFKDEGPASESPGEGPRVRAVSSTRRMPAVQGPSGSPGSSATPRAWGVGCAPWDRSSTPRSVAQARASAAEGSVRGVSSQLRSSPSASKAPSTSSPRPLGCTRSSCMSPWVWNRWMAPVPPMAVNMSKKAHPSSRAISRSMSMTSSRCSRCWKGWVASGPRTASTGPTTRQAALGVARVTRWRNRRRSRSTWLDVERFHWRRFTSLPPSMTSTSEGARARS